MAAAAAAAGSVDAWGCFQCQTPPSSVRQSVDEKGDDYHLTKLPFRTSVRVCAIPCTRGQYRESSSWCVTFTDSLFGRIDVGRPLFDLICDVRTGRPPASSSFAKYKDNLWASQAWVQDADER